MPVFTAIGAAIFGAGTFLAGLTAAALQVAAGIAVNLVAKSMAGEPQAARFSVQGTIQGGDDVPRSINFGWNSTAGSKVYQNEWGIGGVYSTRVIALGDVPVRELAQVEVDGSKVTLGTTAHPTLGFPALQYRKGGKDYLWIKFYDGTQTVADSLLVDSVSSADRPYPDTRVGYGIPYVIATSLAPQRVDGEEKPLFQGFPSYKFATYGVKLYDISKDSSVGGSGTQRWATPSTWGGDGDFLPPVQIYNLLRGIRWNGQWVYGLQDVAAARLPAANWIAQINKARSLKAGPSGNEPQYRAGGEVQVGAPIHLAIEALLTSCQGRLVEVGGSYKIHIGEPDAAVMAFTDGDILSSEEQSFTPFFGLADTINGIAATYPNPAEGWNNKSAPSLLRPDLEIKDGNRRLMASVSLDMVPYGGQVQRLMKSALLEALRARRHTFVLGPEFRVLEAGDVVRWTSVRNGYIDKLFRIDGIVYKANLDVIIDITEVDPADYDWDQDTDYTAVIDGPLTLVGPAPMPMTGWQVFPAVIKDDQGRDRRPSIEVWFASGISSVERVRVQVRVADTTDLMFDGEIPYGDPWKTVLTGQFLPASAYEVRGIFVGPPLSTWSDWLDVTTPDIRLGALDIYEGIIIADLPQSLIDWQAYIGPSVRETIDELRRIASLSAEQDLGNFRDKKTLERKLASSFESSSAKFAELIVAATGPESAIVGRIESLETQVGENLAEAIDLLETQIETVDGKVNLAATAITSLRVAMGGNSANVNVRFSASAGPSGFAARYAIQAAVNDGAFRAVGFFMDVPANPSLPGRIVLQAQQTAIVDTAGNILALFTSDGRLATARIPSIATNMITAGAITTALLAADSVTAAKLNVTTLSAITANLGTVTAGMARSADSKLQVDFNNTRILVLD